MAAIIFSATVAYIATSIDYLLILMILFSQVQTKKEIWQLVIGQYLGTAILVAAGVIAAVGVNFIPQEWVIGLLGLIPIFLGIRAWFGGEEETEEEELTEQLSTAGSRSLFLTVALITIASGGDNIGVYIPYFSSLTVNEMLVALIVFTVLTAVLCYASYRIASLKYIAEILEKYERWILPIVLIGLGMYILIENGTIDAIIRLVL